MQRLLKRLHRVGLLIQCVATFIAHGKADETPGTIDRIVVVLTGKLGDVVCGTPVLRAIRRALPHAHIIVAGISKIQKPVLNDSDLVDEYIDIETGDGVEKLRNANADVAVITGPSFVPTAMAFASGIPLVVSARVVGGFSPSETKPYELMKKFVVTFPYDIKAYAPAERLKVLEPIGIFSSDTKKQLGFSEAAFHDVKKFFIDNHIDLDTDFVAAISPSAGNKIKEWPTGRFAKIADHLALKHNAKVVVIGGQNDHDLVNQTVSRVNQKASVISVTNFNVDQLKAFMSMIHLFVAVDTGPIYIAEAFNVPTVDIVGPVDENVQPPRGPFHRNVIPPSRDQAQLSILNARVYNTEEAQRQTLSITVEAVVDQIDSLISDLHAARKGKK
jgi:ADP-heptose:LPS heptosyltransferase